MGARSDSGKFLARFSRTMWCQRRRIHCAFFRTISQNCAAELRAGEGAVFRRAAERRGVSSVMTAAVRTGSRASQEAFFFEAACCSFVNLLPLLALCREAGFAFFSLSLITSP